MIGRRQFLVMLLAPPPPADPASTDVSLAAGETDIDLGGVKIHTWAYGNRVPAQEIRLRKGQRLRAEVTNAMPQDVTVHWHGIAIVNDMDGVPGLTQAAVPNGQKFTYDFVVPDVGTYWFHSQSTAGFPPIRRWWITVPANGFGCASSMPGRTPRFGWRCPTRR